MGIIRTDQWLKDYFDRPMKICEKLKPYFKGQTADDIYNQLLKFGMYRPSKASRNHLGDMIDYNAWEKVDKIFRKYQKNGPAQIFQSSCFPWDKKEDFSSDSRKGVRQECLSRIRCFYFFLIMMTRKKLKRCLSMNTIMYAGCVP